MAKSGFLVGVESNGTGTATSPTLTSWRTVPNPFGGPTTLASNGRLWVAANFSGIYTSPDAVNWTARPSDIDNGFCEAVCWTGSEFIAVGSWTDGFGNPRAIATSPDGTTWTSRTTPVDAQFPELAAVAGDGTVAVAVGAGTLDHLILRSADGGATWTSIDVPYIAPEILSADDSIFATSVGDWLLRGGASGIALEWNPPGAPAPHGGAGNTAAFSIDPVNVPGGAQLTVLSAAQDEVDIHTWMQFAPGATVTLSASDRHGTPHSNTQSIGAGWTELSTNIPDGLGPPGLVTVMVTAMGGSGLQDVYISDNSYKAKQRLRLMRSIGTDGAGNWVIGAWRTGGGGYPDRPVLASSTDDALTFTAITNVTQFEPRTLIEHDGLWVAGGVGHGGTTPTPPAVANDVVVLTSTNRTAWTARATPADGREVEDAIWATGQFVAAALLDPAVISSADGVVWTAHSDPVNLAGGCLVVGYGPLGVHERNFPRDDGLGISTARSFPPQVDSLRSVPRIP